MSVGVATIGSKNVAAHIESIGRCDNLNLVGVADAGEVEIGKALLYETAEAAIADVDVGIIALCTPPLETQHWIRAASGAGKTILAEMPIGVDSRRSRALVEQCAAVGSPLVGVTDLVYSQPGRQFAGCLEEKIGSPLYLECGISVSDADLANDSTGVLSAHGFGLLALIVKLFGRVDSVYARSRSLKKNRPSEDIAVAQLRFYEGLEGVLIVNGLGDERRTAIQLHGSRGSLSLEEERIRFPDGLEAQYGELANNRQNTGSTRFSGTDLITTQHLLDWIQHSARQNREVSRKEVAVAIGG